MQKLSSAIVIIGGILAAAMFTLNRNESGHFSHAELSSAAATNTNTQVEWPRSVADKKLIDYALDLINNDREKYDVPPLNLSKNKAAQIHANNLLARASQYPSHWSTDGMKPYMKYSIYNGTGYAEQNVAVTAYDNSTVKKCKEGYLLCHRINNAPYEQILDSERKMVYNDSICCHDLHKKNILDRYHTDVSIGISYNGYYFVVVQNLENNYINFSKPLKQDNSHIAIEGNIKLNNYSFDSIGVYYDNVPSLQEYEQNKKGNSYQLGKLVAMVVKPAPPLTHYSQPSNYTLIEPDKWYIKDQHINIRFDLSRVIKTNGVYTIVAYLKDSGNSNKFPSVTYSLFRR